jgi:branched-chain amino acid transport system permease protein
LVDRGLPFLPFDNPFAPDDVPGLSSWILNLAIALVLVIIVGLLLERFAIRPMVGRPVFSIVMITIGLEIIVRTFSVDASKLLARPVAPPWGVETFMLGDARVPWSFLIMYLTVAIAFAGAWLFFRTRAGVAMRAVSFDQEAAMAQGIDVGRVSALVWAAGAVLACLGAVFFAMFPFLPNAVSVEQHPIFVFRVLPVIVLGGLDSVPGALIGGLAIGAAEVFAGAYLAQHTGTLGAGYQQIIPYLIMLMVLLVRPYGLFGSPEVRRV